MSTVCCLPGVAVATLNLFMFVLRILLCCVCLSIAVLCIRQQTKSLAPRKTSKTRSPSPTAELMPIGSPEHNVDVIRLPCLGISIGGVQRNIIIRSVHFSWVCLSSDSVGVVVVWLVLLGVSARK
jgi:hypothetical protein